MQRRFARPVTLPCFLDQISDPANVGAIVRSAVAFGIDAVFLSPGCADPWHPQAIRASAGQLFHLPLITGTSERYTQLVTRLSPVILDASAEHLIQDAGVLPEPLFIFGSEGRGICSPFLKEGLVSKYRIALETPVESLNVAVAAGIILHGWKKALVH